MISAARSAARRGEARLLVSPLWRTHIPKADGDGILRLAHNHVQAMFLDKAEAKGEGRQHIGRDDNRIQGAAACLQRLVHALLRRRNGAAAVEGTVGRVRQGLALRRPSSPVSVLMGTTRTLPLCPPLWPCAHQFQRRLTAVNNDGPQAQALCELDAQMAERASTNDADRLARLETTCLDGREDGRARTHERGCRVKAEGLWQPHA